LIHPDDRERIWEEVQRAVAAGRTFVLDYRIRTASGSRVPRNRSPAASSRS